MIKHLNLIFLVLFLSVVSYSQTNLSNDFSNPTPINITSECNYTEFIFNHTSGNDLEIPRCYRLYPGASSWLSFVVPEDGAATVRFQFDEKTLFGIGLYSFQFGEYQEIKCDVFNSTQGHLYIYPNEQFQNTEIFVRFWKLGEADTGNVEVCVTEESGPGFAKVLSIDVNSYNPQQLVQDVLITGCLTANNITFTGDSDQIGYFSNGIPGLDFAEGVILSSGYVTDAPGPNTSGSMSGGIYSAGDSDLENIVNDDTHDAAVLEFDFVPASDMIEFEYVFASDEYPEFANSSFNDVFAFLVTGGPEGYVNQNIALIPGTTIAVSINNVNDVDFPQYYIDNQGGPNIEYDGMTVTLTATIPVTACETYHIKLAVADCSDSSWDSAVFLKANSFTSGESYTVETFNSWSNSLSVMRGCSNYIVFSRTDDTPLNQAVPVVLSVSGTATPGVDYTEIPTNLEIPAGEESLYFYFDAYDTGTAQGDETIVLTFENGCPCDTELTEHTITIVDAFVIDPEIENDSPICIGDDATLTVALNTAEPENVSIEWSTGDTDVDQIIVSPTTTTTYTADIIYPCDTITLSTTVTVIEPPTVNLGADFEIDALSTDIDAGMAPGNTGEWTLTSGPGSANINPNDASITTVTVDEFGLYNFTWTETSLAPNCLASDDINITFYHVPTADFVATPVLCFGDYSTITFTGEIVDDLAVLEWNFGPATIISGSGTGPYILDFPNSGTFNLSLTVTESTEVAHHNIYVVVPPLLEGTLTAEDDPCFESCNGRATFEVSGGVSPYSYSWGSTSNEIDNLCAGDYGVTVTDINGCSIGETYTINQPTQLEYDTTFSHVICYGTHTGNANISVTGGTPPYQTMWSDGYNMMNNTDIEADIYQVTVYDAHGCSVFEQFNITQPDLLQVVTSGDFAICEHQVVNIAAQPMGGTLPYTVYWDNGDGNGFAPGPQTFQIIPHEDITYTVYVEDANGCISNQATSQTIVSPEIFLDLTTEDNRCYESCDGSATIGITGGLQPFSYSWASNSPLYENLCAGLYTLTITDQIGCTADTMFIINQPPQMQMNLETEDAPCSDSDTGESIAIVSGGTPPYNYVWENANYTNHLIAAPGSYDLTVSDDNNCRIYGTAVIESPQVLRVLPLYNPTICIGGEAQVIAQAAGGTPPYNFYWQGTDSSEEHEHLFYTSPETTTTYNLTVTDDNGCSVDGYNVKVKVHPPLSINHIINSVNNVCLGAGTQIELDISGGNGGPYQVSTSEGDIVGSLFTYYPEETTNLVFTVEDLCETPAVSDSIMIFVHDKPFVDFTIGVTEGCPGHRINFRSLDTAENYEYVWDFGDDIFAFIKNPTHAYSQSGYYQVGLTVQDEFGCTNNITKDSAIFIYPQPYANFSADPQIASILNPHVKFNNYSEDALFYFWYYGDGDSTINFRNPMHYFNDIGEYEVMLVSENEYGCSDTITRTVLVKSEYTIWEPNAFTPNGDGTNDCFKICGVGIDHHTFNLIIYNRWGELVFSTDEYAPDDDCTDCGKGSWDGTRGSHQAGDRYLPNGIYYWYATFTDTEGIGHEHQGNIQLIR
ncbi:MAG: PKD domain-containing protein [Clostridia bacterium]|nr:PKD domain-containing protein [Clostridia bacterium]